MKIAVHGAGYVGLVTAACLADVGHQVVCVDIDPAKIEALRQGTVPIYEPGLGEILARATAHGTLQFTADSADAVRFGELQFIAVGTPQDEDGSADLQYVLAVADSIGRHMTDSTIVVDKSTVPVGTAEKVAERISRQLEMRGLALEFYVCSNPEFLKEGAAIEDFTKGARIVVGTDSEHVRERRGSATVPTTATTKR